MTGPAALALVSVLALAAGAALALPTQAQQDRGPVSIELRFFAFQPNETAVPVGSDVVFKNRQDETHQFVWRDQPLPTVSLVPGTSWEWRFDTPGVYEFRCLFDSTGFERGMRGRIVVVNPPREDEDPAGAMPDTAPGGRPDLVRVGLWYLPAATALLYVRHQLRPNPARPSSGLASVEPTPAARPRARTAAAHLDPPLGSLARAPAPEGSTFAPAVDVRLWLWAVRPFAEGVFDLPPVPLDPARLPLDETAPLVNHA